jgi:glycosyltransferase involved in cell wall biosynthesis
MPKDLSLVVPCYNEAGHLRASVAAVLEVLDQMRWDYEVVFVDDASRDDTRRVIEELCAASDRCRAVFHERNRGRGAAFKTGFAASSGRVTGFIDIDLEVHASYVPPLVNLVERHGQDVATGYRYYLLRQTGAVHRFLLSQVYRAVLKALLDCGVRDTETGCKFFRRETAGAVVLGSDADGWFWDTEVMARAALADLRITEWPVLFLRRWDKASTVRLLPDTWRYLVELHRFRPKVGLSLLSKSPIYWTCVGYDAVMRVLYGRGYRQSYADVAARIPDGASVVDLCCGTGRLGLDFLLPRGCEYVGLDFNGHFVMGVRKRGGRARFWNALTDPVPEADYVVMCSSFYHFREIADDVLARMRAAARAAVIVSEPVENVSASRSRLVAGVARALTNPGVGAHGARFDLEGFRAFAARHGAAELAWRPGDRNAVAVFPPR